MECLGWGEEMFKNLRTDHLLKNLVLAWKVLSISLE
jgi:hypothetical protein